MWGKVGNVEITEAINISAIPIYLKINVDKIVVDNPEAKHNSCPFYSGPLHDFCNAQQQNCYSLHQSSSCPLLRYDFIKVQVREDDR